MIRYSLRLKVANTGWRTRDRISEKKLEKLRDSWGGVHNKNGNIPAETFGGNKVFIILEDLRMGGVYGIHPQPGKFRGEEGGRTKVFGLVSPRICLEEFRNQIGPGGK